MIDNSRGQGVCHPAERSRGITRPGQPEARQRIGRYARTRTRSWRLRQSGPCATVAKIRPEPPHGQSPGIGIADLPGGTVVHLGAVQDGHHVRGGVDRVSASLENVLLGLGAEGGKVLSIKQITRPSHGNMATVIPWAAEPDSSLLPRFGVQPGQKCRGLVFRRSWGRV